MSRAGEAPSADAGSHREGDDASDTTATATEAMVVGTTVQVQASSEVGAAAVPRQKLSGYDFWRDVLGSPRTVVAPMVDQSELAWRELSRRYGADLCYTPMINSSSFLRNPKGKRGVVFTTAPDDRPLIAQFCGHDPDMHIARRGRYGAFLMEDWELIAKLVRTLHEGLDIPVTCKIRVFPDLAKTIAYAKMIEASGCQMLTVHGRTIKQKGQLTGIADWEAIKAVKEAVSIPVVANGNILYEADVDECIRQTGVDGVMSAEANLTNPTLFSKEGQHHVWKITEEYFEIVKKHDTPWGFVKSHLFKMWHACLRRHVDLRDRLGQATSMETGEAVAAELKKRLIEAEARGDESDIAHGTHAAKSGPHEVLPYWICQPRVRDLEKDQRVMAESQVKCAELATAKAAARALKKEAERAAVASAPAEGHPAPVSPTGSLAHKRARTEQDAV